MDSWEFRPPVLVGERVVWLGSGSGIPQGGVVRWIGKLPEMGPDWTVGMELDNQLPFGGIDGTWGNRHLFSCKPKHGLIVPITTTLREHDLFHRPARQPGSSGSSQHGSGDAGDQSTRVQQAPARRRKQYDQAQQAEQSKPLKQAGQSKQQAEQTQQRRQAAQYKQQAEQSQQLRKAEQYKQQAEQAQKLRQAEQYKQLRQAEQTQQQAELTKYLKQAEQSKQLKSQQLRQAEQTEEQAELAKYLKQAEQFQQLRQAEQVNKQAAQLNQYKQDEDIKLKKQAEVISQLKQAEEINKLKQAELIEQLKQSQLHEQRRQSELSEQLKQFELAELLRQSELAELLRQAELDELLRQAELAEVVQQSRLDEQLIEPEVSGQQEAEDRTPSLAIDIVADFTSFTSREAEEQSLPTDPRPAQRRKKTFPQRPTRLKATGNKFQVNSCGSATLPCETIKEESEYSRDSTPIRCDSLPFVASACDTLKSVTSYDYKWYDAVDKVILDAKSSVQVPVGEGVEETNITNTFSNQEVNNHDRVQGEIMNNLGNIDSSYEETVTVTDEIYSAKYNANSLLRSSSSSQSQTGSGSRKEKVNSGFFSFLRWFRKGKDDDDESKHGEFVEGVATPSAPSSPRLDRSHNNSSCGSIDSLFSTATVSSFNFVSPTSYRPYGNASQPEKCIAVGVDTDTYRNRLKYRDRARELDRNLTLKKKYRLYASDSLSTVVTPNASPVLKLKRNDQVQTELTVNEPNKSILPPSPGSQNSTFGRKKRRAPVPPNLPKAQYSDYSLPNTLESKPKVSNSDKDNERAVSLNKTHHRRTASESSKDKKAGAYCHVKGKRKAPSPPKPGNELDESNSGTLEKVRSPFSSFGRKKRPAPLPPGVKGKANKESQVEQLQETGNKTTLSNLSAAERDKLISNIAKLQAVANRRSMGSPPASPHLAFRTSHQEQIVCNDTLKLERGVLKSNKEMPKVEPNVAEVKVAPCSPRPWYKRSLSKSDGNSSGGGLLKRDIFKSLEKKKDREKEKEDEWMPEGGIARSSVVSVSSDSGSASSNRFNIFARLDKSDEKKKDGEKRKSQVSILANISELDREAAAIVQKEHARENALMEAHDAKFYSYPEVPGIMGNFEEIDEPDNVEAPKRSSARELISLFNSIGNVTRVTVNTSFFSKDGFFSKEGMEKRFSFMGESKTTEEKIVISETKASERHLSPVSSPNARRRVMTSGLTIEEVDDEVEKESKARALYEANKSRRHRSPSPNFPTIAEQSESASSLATTPLSTIHQPRPTSPPVNDTTNQVWICPRCTLENPRWKITCDVCNRWRPSASEMKTADEEDPVERPSSPVPFMDQDNDDGIVKNGEKNDKKVVLNWEEELRRYFPDSPKVARGKKEAKVESEVNVKENGNERTKTKIANGVSVKTETSTEIVVREIVLQNKLPPRTATKKEEDVSTKKMVITNPSNFIGGRLNKDEASNKTIYDKTVTSKVENGVIGSDLPAIEETDVDELRKVRLAFFHRPSDNITEPVADKQNTTVNVDEKKKPIDENERTKLREMLKEMKNSLPKRPKVNGSQVSSEDSRKSINLENNDIFKQIESSSVSYQRKSFIKEDDANKHGAIKKVPLVIKEETKENVPLQKIAQDSQKNMNNGKSEALFITKTTVYENIKMKKVDASKPQKVSSSAQTSAVVRKIEPTKPPRGKPPQSQSNLPSLNDSAGVMYMSLNKEPRRIGKGTFELIRARDFKSIEATKTGSDIVPAHVYANMPSSPVEHHSSPKDVLPQQPSAPVLEDVLRVGVLSPIQNGKSPELDDDMPPSLQESSDQWSSATESPVPRSPDSRSTRGSRRSQGSGSAAVSEASSYSAASCRSGDTSEVERLTAQLTMPKGLADFKANLQLPSEKNNMNTLAVNRLLRRLEAAIAGGQHIQAAGLARDLARQKISCSVTRQRRSLDSSPAAVMVDMYVEDKVSHQGPIPLQVIPSMTVAQLKLKVEQELEIPVGVQRWILGKILASDDSKTLEDHNVNASGCPMFLYLVAPDGDQEGDTGSQPGNTGEIVNTVPEDDDVGPPLPAPLGKGWYYNYEEDHYSLCEDSEDDLSDEEVEELRILSPVKEVPPPPTRGNVPSENVEEVEDVSEEEEEEEEEELVEINAASVAVSRELPVAVVNAPVLTPTAPQVPRLPAAFSPVAGSSRAEAVPVARRLEAAKSPPPPKVENKTSTLRLGWLCPVCTLVNAPTRPGCAACTTERPLQYVVPTEYRANQQEMERLEREQQHDNDMEQATAEERRQVVVDQHQHYLQLVNLDKADLVPNAEAFDCSVCLTQYGPGEGTVLRECLHIFCKPCLVNTVQFNQEAEVKCPYRDADYACDSVLQEREIKALVPKNVYELHLAKSVSQAENKIGNAFHCKTPDCRGWCIFEDNLNEFRCPVCIKNNCLTCQAIHEGVNCRQYQEQVKQESETNIEARRTKDMLEEMVDRGEAMKCPTCHVILMKKWGCDWLRCSMCKTEICWVTRGPRWGPGGKGDTTGGCQCGLNGIKCHPRCNYCH